MNIFDLHQKMTAHLFPAFSSHDERFLALALCGEAGELANMVKKRWRDASSMKDGADFSAEIRDEIADIRIYLELIAKCFDIDRLDLMAEETFVVEEHGDDEHFIALALCSRVGHLSSIVENRWIANSTNGVLSAQIAIIDVRIYLEKIAKLFGIEGKKLNHQVEQKLAKVIQKHKIKESDVMDHRPNYSRPTNTLR